MKHLKRIVLLLACVVLICVLLPKLATNVHAEIVTGTCGADGDGSNLTWKIDTSTGVMTIAGTGDMADYSDFEESGPDPQWRGHWPEISQVHTLVIEEGVTSIGEYAFQWYNNIEHIYIPTTLTRIGTTAFGTDDDEADTARDVYISDLTAWANVQKDYGIFDWRYGYWLYLNNSSIDDLVLPSSVTQLPKAAFAYCNSISSVTLPNGLSTISSEAFRDCHNLTEITIPNGVTRVEADAFKECRRLKTISFPDSVNEIGDQAFRGCTSLSSVAIGQNLTKIGSSAFSEAYKLKDVYYTGDSNTNISIGTSNYLFVEARSHFSVSNPGTHWEVKNPCVGLFSCSCGYEKTESSEAVGHDYVDHAAQAPTCTEIGWDAYQTCSRCDYTSYVEIPALGHDLTELDREDATCTEDGEVFYRCTRCRRYITEELPALGHDFGDWAVSVDPTCTEEGEECRSCSRCTEVETRTTEALGHNYQSVVTAPTCTAGGFTTYTCSRCNDSYVADTVEALGHTPGEAFEENRVEPSCTEVGVYDTVTVCTVCGTELSNVHTELAALGHDWSEWQRTAEPTCTEAGEDSRSCGRCHETETRSVEALGHDYQAVVTAPTCTEGGFTTYTCSRCNDSYVSDQVDALGHDYAITVMRDATIAKTGRMGVSCSRCDFDEFVVLPKLSEEDYTLSNNTATCTEAGTATYTWVDTTYGLYSVEGPTTALGHALAYTAVDAAQHQITCARCDYSLTEAHSFDETGACVCGMQESGIVSDTALKIKFASLTLKSDLAINFYVPEEVLAEYSEPYVVFTKAVYDAQGNLTGYEETTAREHPLSGKAGDGTNCLGFPFAGVNAKEIGSAVTATLYGTKNGLLCKGPTVDYSARTYAMNQLSKTDDEELRTLLVDMLNYGALAQIYWDYHTDHLANEGLTAAQQAYATQTDPTLGSCRNLIRNTGATVGFKSCSLSLNERVTINYYLNLTNYTGDVSDLEAHVSFTDIDGKQKTVVVDSAKFVQKQHTDGKIYTVVPFAGLDARQMRTSCTCEVFSKTSHARVSDTVVYSIESYASVQSAAVDQNLVSLIYAMMKYGDAAAAYCD